MSIKRLLITLVSGFAVTVLLSACEKYVASSDDSAPIEEQQNYLKTDFDVNYLTRNPWYGVASIKALPRCLSKLTFKPNNVVNSTYYASNNGVALESADLLYTVENNLNFSINERYVFHYYSHDTNHFITNEARFFKNYSDAIAFADANFINCRLAFPE